MWVPAYSVKEVTFLIENVPFWRAWAERKLVEWEVEGSPAANIELLVKEANKFEGVGHSRKG